MTNTTLYKLLKPEKYETSSIALKIEVMHAKLLYFLVFQNMTYMLGLQDIICTSAIKKTSMRSSGQN
jgi:hypothetical protein